MAVKDFITELAQKAGLDAELTASLLKATENPQFAKELEGGVQRQSEFSRAMDQLRAKETEFNNASSEWKKWHDNNVAYVKTLEAKVGVVSPTDPTKPTATTPDDFAKQIKDAKDSTLALSVNITKQALKVQDDYRARFGKALDLDALEKHALDKGLPIQLAYEDMIKPEVEAATKVANEKALADARAEGAKEALSKHNLPVDNAPADAAGISAFYAEKPAQPLTEGQRARNFADTWNQTAGA